FRESALSQKFEVRRLAKEVRLVCRDDIDQIDKFVLNAATTKHELAIFAIRSHVQAPQAALKTNLDHRLLFRAQADAGLGPDQLAEACEVAPRKRLLIGGVMMRHCDPLRQQPPRWLFSPGHGSPSTRQLRKRDRCQES